MACSSTAADWAPTSAPSWSTRSDFWLLIAAAVLTQVVGVAFLGAVFRRIPSIKGWTLLGHPADLRHGLHHRGRDLPVLRRQWHLARMHQPGRAGLRADAALLPSLPGHVGSQVGLPRRWATSSLGGILHRRGLGARRRSHGRRTVALAVVLLVSAIVVKLAIAWPPTRSRSGSSGRSPSFAYAMHRSATWPATRSTIYAMGVDAWRSGRRSRSPSSLSSRCGLLDHGNASWVGLLTPLVAGYCVAVAWWVVPARAAPLRVRGQLSHSPRSSYSPTGLPTKCPVGPSRTELPSPTGIERHGPSVAG